MISQMMFVCVNSGAWISEGQGMTFDLYLSRPAGCNALITGGGPAHGKGQQSLNGRVEIYQETFCF